MRVLFSTGTLYGLPFPLAFGLASAAGCDGVELVLDPWSVLAGPRAVTRVARWSCCPVQVLHPSLYPLPGWRGPEQAFPQLAQWAVDLGAPVVVVHPPRFTQQQRNIERFDRGLEAFRRVAQGSVILALENSAVFFPEDRRNPFVWPERVAEFARERGLPVALDTTHVSSIGLSMTEGYAPVRGQLVHVHLSGFRQPPQVLDRPSLDTFFKHHQLLEHGEAEFSAWFEELQRDGYAGDFTLELSPAALEAWNPCRARRHLEESVAMVWRWWWAAQRQVPAQGAVEGVQR